MKLKIMDRMLLAFYSFLGIIDAAAAILLIIYRRSFSMSIMGVTLGFQSNWFPTVVILVLLALLLLLWSIKIFLLAFKREPKLDISSVSVQNTEDGSVRISLEALDTLVKQAIGHQEGILDIQAKIINHEDSISVRVEMTLTSDVHIPNVTMLLQRTIKNFVEEFSGIAVREVTVFVSSIVEVVPAPLAIETKGEEANVQSAPEEDEAALFGGSEIPGTEEISDTPSDEVIDDEEAVILDEGSSYFTVEDVQDTIDVEDDAQNHAEGSV